MAPVHLVVPGRLDTLTGGYGYDRRVVAGLRDRGWQVTVHELDDSFPLPDEAARAQATATLAAIPDGDIVVLDGLALGALPDEVQPHAGRLRLVALVHHPLAAETGLDFTVAAQLESSERRALAHVRRVIVTSAATAAMLDPYDVPRERITVINPGTDRAAPARGSAGPEVHLLCVASLTPRKGHEVLFRALAEMPQRNWRLTCVGSLERDPGMVRRLRGQLAQSGVDDRVSLVGEMNGAALARVYDGADVFVLATLYEGYGMVVAEALAHGLPVVATRTGAIGDLVEPSAGVLVPPGDSVALAAALARVTGEPAYRARLAEGARTIGEQLPTWEQSCAQMAETLAALRPEARG
jgi:glycosyltransferase involved in cell wall biosynthesis